MIKKPELLKIAAQFSAYDVQFSDTEKSFEIINPFGKDPIVVVYHEMKEPDTSYIVCFSCYHVHLETVDEVIAQVRDILEDKKGVIEFYRSGHIAMSTDLDTQDLRELTCEALAVRMGVNGDSQMSFYTNYADSFKIRGWGKDADVDASFVKDAQGNVSIQSANAVILAHKCCSRNQNLLQKSKKCGCFHCLATFAPEEISDWIIEKNFTEQLLSQDDLSTARCPYCGTDSVIGDASGFPITKKFLRAMEKHWFHLL